VNVTEFSGTAELVGEFCVTQREITGETAAENDRI
jgi:hypothetical protein